MWEFLPTYLQLKLGKDQEGGLSFPSMHSEIISLPATEDSGRMTGATIVVTDELEYHPYAEKNFGALFPTVTAGGQFIALSTADKTKMDTFFKTLYQRAKSGRNNFKPIFLPWYLRPGRNKEWFEGVIKDIPDWVREQEFPNTEEEALTPLKTRMFFSRDMLNGMGNNLKPPIKHEISDKFSGIVRIWQLPVVGKRYALFTDPSDGQEDPHAIIVVDGITKEQVAESHGKTTADVCALIHDNLVRLYNNAFNGFERNTRAGGVVGAKLDELATPNQAGFLRVKDNKLDSTKHGWHTSLQLWNLIIWSLEETVRTNCLTIRSQEAIDEFRQFIVPEGQDPQKVRGGHDDYIDAWARVVYLCKYLPGAGNQGGVVSFKYRETY